MATIDFIEMQADGKVGIGTNTPTRLLHIEGAGGHFRVVDTDGRANITLVSQEAAPAQGTVIGRIALVGMNDAAQETIYALLDAEVRDDEDGSEDGDFVLLVRVGGSVSERLRVVGDGNMLLASGHLTLSDGGAVTQATNITTGVTINRESGQITTVSQTLAAGANATFTVTNSKVGANDRIIPNVVTNNGAGTFVAHITDVQAGRFDITVENIHASDAGDNTLVIGFAIMGGSIT